MVLLLLLPEPTDLYISCKNIKHTKRLRVETLLKISLRLRLTLCQCCAFQGLHGEFDSAMSPGRTVPISRHPKRIDRGEMGLGTQATFISLKQYSRKQEKF